MDISTLKEKAKMLSENRDRITNQLNQLAQAYQQVTGALAVVQDIIADCSKTEAPKETPNDAAPAKTE
jgi:prefoldin subunit 5